MFNCSQAIISSFEVITHKGHNRPSLLPLFPAKSAFFHMIVTGIIVFLPRDSIML